VRCGRRLAAVYNVPLGGALFTLEVLLGSFSLSAVIPAIATSGIAAYVAWIGLGDETPYLLQPLSVNQSLIAWSIVAGPLFGLKMPLTAIALMMEFTRVDHDFLIPMGLAVAGSVSASRLAAIYVGDSKLQAVRVSLRTSALAERTAGGA